MRRFVKTTTSFVLITLGIFLSLFFLAKNAHAGIRCEIQYGGGEICVKTGDLQIDKKVIRPETDEEEAKLVDNLGVNDHKFHPGQTITFKLFIKNVGEEGLNNITLKDELPPLLELTGGKVEEKIEHLDPDETVERLISARVVSVDQFPSDNSTPCVTNTAEVYSPDDDGHRDKDTSQVCLERQVGEILPATGSEEWMVVFGGSVLLALVGGGLIRRSKLMAERG